MTINKLVELLKPFENCEKIRVYGNGELVHIGNIDNELLLSAEKPLGYCLKCGNNVFPTSNNNFKSYCISCDEDMYGFEFELNKKEK